MGREEGKGVRTLPPWKLFSNLINSNIKIKFTENIPRKTLLPLRHMRFIIYTAGICNSENKTSAIYLPTWLILIIVYIDSRTKNNVPNAFPFDFGFDEYFPADSEQVIGNGGTCTVETVNTGYMYYFLVSCKKKMLKQVDVIIFQDVIILFVFIISIVQINSHSYHLFETIIS